MMVYIWTVNYTDFIPMTLLGKENQRQSRGNIKTYIFCVTMVRTHVEDTATWSSFDIWRHIHKAETYLEYNCKSEILFPIY